MRSLATLLCLLSVSAPLWAITFDLPPPDSNIVGSFQYHTVVKGETLAKIGDEYDVGFLGLMAANSGVDPFLPQENLAVMIPTKIILPAVRREGIVVNLAELRLYYFDPDKEHVHIFPVGIGRIGRDTPVMETSIREKRPSPTWTPTAAIRKEYLLTKGITLPAVVPAGPDNPLGDFALRLAHGSGEYLIHGTNKNFGIGMRVSSGCIRMNPADIDWLFHQVKPGLKVKIINDPVKFSVEPDQSVYIEAHEPLTRSNGVKQPLTMPQELSWTLEELGQSDAKARAAIYAQNGIPLEITRW